MTMTKREAIRQNEQENRLMNLGFTRDESQALRRISMTLRRWYEMECGTGDDRVSRSIERDDVTDKPFMRIQYQGHSGWVDQRFPTPDREKGAIKRLLTIINNHAERTGRALSTYLQTDPRGAALYIIRPGDVPKGKDVSAYYPNALCVY